MVKNPLAMWETWVWSLVWEDPQEEGMATHSSFFAWRIPMERGTWQATVHRAQRVGRDWVTKYSTQHSKSRKLIEPCFGMFVQWKEMLTVIYGNNHPYGRKSRRTKEPLDESERGEWKSWLETQHSENEDCGIQSHNFMGNRWGNWKQWQALLSRAPKSLQLVTAAMKLKEASFLEKNFDQPRQHVKKQSLLCGQRFV